MTVIAIKEELENVNLYPEGSSKLLREKVTQKLNLDKETNIISNDEDNSIDLMGTAFIDDSDEVSSKEELVSCNFTDKKAIELKETI